MKCRLAEIHTHTVVVHFVAEQAFQWLKSIFFFLFNEEGKKLLVLLVYKLGLEKAQESESECPTWFLIMEAVRKF